MEEALKSRQNVFEQDVVGCLNEIKVYISKTTHPVNAAKQAM